jgi:hypothetical protein
MMNQEEEQGRNKTQFMGCCWLAGTIDDSVGKALAVDMFKLGHARPDIK